MTESKAILFDFDGTLVDSLGIWKEVDILFLEKRGYIYEETEIDFSGKTFSECAAYTKEVLDLSESVEDIKREWIDLSIQLCDRFVSLKPYAKEFVKAARRASYKTAIGTANDQEIVRPILESYGLINEFDNILTCCEVGKAKPYPNIYLTLAEQLNVEPQDCIVFEDTLEGVLAGKKAGMFVYAVEDSFSLKNRDEIIKNADKFITGFEYFKEYFNDLASILNTDR